MDVIHAHLLRCNEPFPSPIEYLNARVIAIDYCFPTRFPRSVMKNCQEALPNIVAENMRGISARPGQSRDPGRGNGQRLPISYVK